MLESNLLLIVADCRRVTVLSDIRLATFIIQEVELTSTMSTVACSSLVQHAFPLIVSHAEFSRAVLSLEICSKVFSS